MEADALPDDKYFLEEMFAGVKAKRIDAATCDNVPMSREKIYKVVYAVYNDYQWLSQWISPIASGLCIFSTKNAFEQVGGFNERLPFAEDADFVSKVHKKGLKFRVLDEPQVLVSVRRFEKKGLLKTIEHIWLYDTKRRLLGARQFKANYDFDIYR
jgi:hypothetical protein